MAVQQKTVLEKEQKTKMKKCIRCKKEIFRILFSSAFEESMLWVKKGFQVRDWIEIKCKLVEKKSQTGRDNGD